jgi:hypothetical protein
MRNWQNRTLGDTSRAIRWLRRWLLLWHRETDYA